MRRTRTVLLREGDYIAEVEVELIITDKSWSPTLSLEDAKRLDDIRQSLRQGNFEAVAPHGAVYKLTPIAI